MNKYFFTGLLFVVLFLSCAKDDDKMNEQITDRDLIGAWKVVEVKSNNGKVSGYIKQGIINVPLKADIDITGKNYTMIVTFEDNPKNISFKGNIGVVIKVNMPIIGEKKYEQNVPSIPNINGSWEVKNKSLITTNAKKTNTTKITSYNKSEIVFSFSLDNNFSELLSGFDINDGKIEGDLIVKAVRN